MKNFEDFINNSLINYSYPEGISGMETFVKSIEFQYFSEVRLKNRPTADDGVNLVLELTCNLELLELLFHFNTGRWGNNLQNKSPIEQSLNSLNAINNTSIDIEELTLFLADTTIVIKRIFKNSIALEFDNIIKEIASNYVFLTKGLTKKPFEIFVPIFEDTLNADSIFDATEKTKERFPKTYTEYWGVYLDTDEEASIFDLQTNAFINGDVEFYLAEDN